MVVSPNSSKVILLFGKYKGSVKQEGFSGQILFIPKPNFPYVQEILKAKRSK
jgi:hypothetical protein